MNDYLNVANPNPQATDAILMIPDIWGQTDYSQATAQGFADDYGLPCYSLDYFYQVTGRPSRFDPQNDGDTAVGLMDSYRGEDFVAIFERALADIKTAQPSLQSLTVIGFCFGGRLAYLTGLEKIVDKIVSFYGAGALRPGFYKQQSAIEALCESRNSDPGLEVLAFFGTEDASISPQDRKTTQDIFGQTQISYQPSEQPVGHAYFQPGRPNYDASAAALSKAVLDKFLLP